MSFVISLLDFLFFCILIPSIKSFLIQKKDASFSFWRALLYLFVLVGTLYCRPLFFTTIFLHGRFFLTYKYKPVFTYLLWVFFSHSFMIATLNTRTWGNWAYGIKGYLRSAFSTTCPIVGVCLLVPFACVISGIYWNRSIH